MIWQKYLADASSACAGLLAKRGIKVLLLEKNTKAGGKAMAISKNGFTYTAWVVVAAPNVDNAFEKVLKELGKIGSNWSLPIPPAGPSTRTQGASTFRCPSAR